MTVKRRSGPVRLGQALAAGGILLGVVGVVVIVVMGRWDHLPLGTVLFAVFASGFGGLAWLAFGRQPENRAVWVPAGSAFLVGVSGAGLGMAVWAAHAAGLDVTADAWLALTPAESPLMTTIGMELLNVGPVFGFFSMLTLWPLLFPDGRLPSPAWRWVVGATLAAMGLLLFVLGWVVRPGSTVPYGAQTSTYPPGIPSLADPLYLVLVLTAGVCVVSLVVRYRRSAGDLRQQYRWVLWGTIWILLALIVVEQTIWQLLAALAGITIGVVCYGVAVTKHRLYDIDVVISRTIVFGTLAVFIGSVYVVVVVLVGDLIGARAGSLPLSVTATAMVAVAFEPVRRTAQRWANRLVYGKRATPYEVLGSLARRLAGAEPAGGVLERMTQLMAEGTGAHQTTVWLSGDEGLVAMAGWPGIPTPGWAESLQALHGVSVPVFHEDEMVGALEVRKAKGHPVTPTERRLISDLAGSAGLVLGHQRLNAALTAQAAELRASRRRLVELGDAERRRLERDLHDGAQQQVVALKLKISLAERMATAAGANDLAGGLRLLTDEVQEVLEEIRGIAHGIYPQLLESENVVTAIRSQAATLTVPVSMTVAVDRRYPPEVEAAVYFTAVEAMANAVAYASPGGIVIDIVDTGGELIVEVSDDGDGFDPKTTDEGVGLTNIRDRVEALGGVATVESSPETGTRVRVRIPVAARGQDESAAVDLKPDLGQSFGHEVRLG